MLQTVLLLFIVLDPFGNLRLVGHARLTRVDVKRLPQMRLRSAREERPEFRIGARRVADGVG